MEEVGLPVLALRGRHTRERVPDSDDETLLADPGLLAPELLVSGLPTRRSDDVVVVPHGMHADTAFVDTSRRATGVIVVDVRENPLDTIAKIAASRFVFSSSLHGLVIADAFGIPNAWIQPGVDLYGGGFKFDDYYSSFGLERTPVPMFEIGDDTVSFAKAHLDDPAYRTSENLVAPKQERLTELFEDLASV
jgi:pyruvyltransferase